MPDMTIPVTHYADVRVTGDGVPQIVGTLVTLLHGFMVSREARLAVAFPKYKNGDRPKIGEVVRFFGNADVLNNLLDDLDGDERERWMCGRVKETPECDRWASYLRVALPARPDLSKPKRARFAAYAAKRRLRMLHDMQELPFFFVKSQSGDTHFPFTVEKRILKEGRKSSSDATPGTINAYGFSTRSQMVFLPEF
jgi:CRISPR-associated endoribonuclease Cas6/Csy4 subtype I-F